MKVQKGGEKIIKYILRSESRKEKKNLFLSGFKAAFAALLRICTLRILFIDLAMYGYIFVIDKYRADRITRHKSLLETKLIAHAANKKKKKLPQNF